MSVDRLTRDPASVVALSAKVSRRTGIPRAHVVKDFWVTEILRGLSRAAQHLGVEIYFKGGTSLSKADRLIERFSEDVDILVVSSHITRGAADSTLRALVRGVEGHIGLSALVEADGTSKGLRRSVRFIYPTLEDADQTGVKSGVLLELGGRGGAMPSKRREIKSLIGEHMLESITSYQEATSFVVDALEPQRTLVEKLSLLHTACEFEPLEAVHRHARHYYDIHRLLSHEETRRRLEGNVLALARDVATYSKIADRPISERPGDGFASSQAFAYDGRMATRLRSTYDEQVLGQLVWPGAIRPTFDDCLEIVHAHGSVL